MPDILVDLHLRIKKHNDIKILRNHDGASFEITVYLKNAKKKRKVGGFENLKLSKTTVHATRLKAI